VPSNASILAPSAQPPPQVRIRFARALSRLYFIRTGISLAWVLAVSALAGSLDRSSSPGALTSVLLVLYPISDAAATLVDIRTTPAGSQTLFQRLNLVTGIVAAAAVSETVHHGFAAILDTFGGWALISGAIQLIVALRRHTLITAQWFMVISGADSIFAGTTFLRWSGTAHDGLSTLIQYSTGGALWYLIAAVSLSVSAWKATHTADHRASV
jgi:uncharacterized membrane protein HdeD (DUF308 family)